MNRIVLRWKDDRSDILLTSEPIVFRKDSRCSEKIKRNMPILRRLYQVDIEKTGKQ